MCLAFWHVHTDKCVKFTPKHGCAVLLSSTSRNAVESCVFTPTCMYVCDLFYTHTALEASSAYPSLPITPSVPQRALNISPSPSQSQSQSQSQSSSSSTLLGLPSFSTGLNTAAAHAHMHTINSSISLLPESTGVAPYGSAANTAQATHDAAAGDAGAGGSAVHAYVHPRPPALYDHSVDSVERTQRLMLQQTSSFGDEADVHENDDDCYGDDDGEAALLTTSQHSALQAMGGEMHGLATSSRFVQLLAHPNKRAVAPPSSTAGAGRQGGSASTLNTRTSAMTGMHTRRRQLLERNARHKVGSHAHPLAWLVAWIRALYDDKTRADNSARGDNLPIQPLPEFLYELQRKKYGLQNIIDQKTWDVLMAVSNFRDLSQEVSVVPDPHCMSVHCTHRF